MTGPNAAAEVPVQRSLQPEQLKIIDPTKSEFVAKLQKESWKRDGSFKNEEKALAANQNAAALLRPDAQGVAHRVEANIVFIADKRGVKMSNAMIEDLNNKIAGLCDKKALDLDIWSAKEEDRNSVDMLGLVGRLFDELGFKEINQAAANPPEQPPANQDYNAQIVEIIGQAGRLSNLNEKDIREMLAFVAGRNTIGMLHQKMAQVNRDEHSGKISHSKAEGLRGRYRKMAEKAEPIAAKVDNDLEVLIQNGQGEKKAFGLNIKKHILKRKLEQVKQEQEDAVSEGRSTKLIDKQIAQLDKDYKQADEDAKNYKDPNGVEYPDVFAAQALTFLTKLSAQPISDKDRLTIVQDPLGELERRFNDLAADPVKMKNSRGVLVEALGDEGAEIFEQQLKLETLDKAVTGDERMGLVRNIGLGSMGIMGLFLYLAYMMEQKKGGGGGG